MNDHEQMWTAVAQLLRAQLTEAVWFSTFQDVVALESDPNTMRVSAPNAHSRDRILSRYLPLVRDALEEIGAAHVRFVVEVQVAEAEVKSLQTDLERSQVTAPIDATILRVTARKKIVIQR